MFWNKEKNLTPQPVAVSLPANVYSVDGKHVQYATVTENVWTHITYRSSVEVEHEKTLCGKLATVIVSHEAYKQDLCPQCVAIARNQRAVWLFLHDYATGW